MKAIIYAGIGLFSIASVYGVADYYISNKNGSIDNLYKEAEPIQALGKLPVIMPFEETAVKKPVEKTGAVDITKTIENKKTKRFSLDDFSRARIPELVVDERIDIPVEQPVKTDTSSVIKTAEINQ